MKVFIHIGLHKTGTTSIQAAFSAARLALRQEAGLIYPTGPCPARHPLGHHLLPWSVVQRPGYLPLGVKKPSTIVWEVLRDELEVLGCPTVLLSSEEFDSLTAEEIEDIGRRLEGYEITPVMYFRNHPDLIDSMYRTAVKNGYPHTIEHLVGHSRTRFDYRQMVEDWGAIAANGKVLAHNYDEVRSDVVAHFARSIGVDNALLSEDRKRWNVSAGSRVMSDELQNEITNKYADENAFLGSLAAA